MYSTTSAPNFTAASERDRYCLGLSLSTREIGYALVHPTDGLARYGVLNIRKLHVLQAREARTRQFVSGLLDRKPCAMLAYVGPAPAQADSPLIEAITRWLTETTEARGLRLQVYDRSEIRAQVSPATNRQLALTLSQRFPALARLASATATPVRGHLVPDSAVSHALMPTPKERYWSSMFLALGAIQLATQNPLPMAVTPSAPHSPPPPNLPVRGPQPIPYRQAGHQPLRP